MKVYALLVSLANMKVYALLVSLAAYHYAPDCC
jgi:hypothetical protein